ncbi:MULTISPECIES: phage tail assembly protein [Bacillaceae]|uniref:phage tail assembly protein n=1 Tax=Bacillaceae TaxID=186817 RepID=UPI001BE63B28|nr:phage tail assembly protein [Bacillus sp. ISL-57]MBT2717552.1 phage tail assembly protein [Bacillus sp. ISL-57]
MNAEKTTENKKVENNKVVVFNKPYQFEGNEYKEIDLSKLEDLTGEDLLEADKQFAASGQFAVVTEMSMGYCFIIAALTIGQPIEFFNKLPAKEVMKVKNQVIGFLNN